MMAFEPKLFSQPGPTDNKKFYHQNRFVLRRFETIIKKIVNAKWAVIFNGACIKENIYIYIYIYIHM